MGEALRWEDVVADEDGETVRVRREMETAFATEPDRTTQRPE